MTFPLAAVTAGLAAGTILAGLAAIAGVLFLLQRLRVRHRPVLVISTLFWRAAVEEARARVLVERFRHPLVYLFLLAICAFLWLAAAGLDGEDRDGRRHLVLVEGSAAAGVTEARLAETLRSVATHVGPPDALRDGRRSPAPGRQGSRRPRRFPHQGRPGRGASAERGDASTQRRAARAPCRPCRQGGATSGGGRGPAELDRRARDRSLAPRPWAHCPAAAPVSGYDS